MKLVKKITPGTPIEVVRLVKQYPFIVKLKACFVGYDRQKDAVEACKAEYGYIKVANIYAREVDSFDRTTFLQIYDEADFMQRFVAATSI